jgi:hypothetical protein
VFQQGAKGLRWGAGATSSCGLSLGIVWHQGLVGLMFPLGPTPSPSSRSTGSSVEGSASDDATKQGTYISAGVGAALFILIVLFCIYRRSLRTSASPARGDDKIKWTTTVKDVVSPGAPVQPPWQMTSRSTFTGMGMNDVYLHDSAKGSGDGGDVIPSASPSDKSAPASRQGSVFNFINPFRSHG